LALLECNFDTSGFLASETNTWKRLLCGQKGWRCAPHYHGVGKRRRFKNYINSGPHLKAMKAFSKIATGKTYRLESKEIPTLEEAVEIWNTKATSIYVFFRNQ